MDIVIESVGTSDYWRDGGKKRGNGSALGTKESTGKALKGS